MSLSLGLKVLVISSRTDWSIDGGNGVKPLADFERVGFARLRLYVYGANRASSSGRSSVF